MAASELTSHRARRAGAGARSRRRRAGGGASSVIHQEKSWTCQTRAGSVRVPSRQRPVDPCGSVPRSPRPARGRRATARFRPLAPVGGTMWAASPARKSRPYCIGSATKLRMRRDRLVEDRARRPESSRRRVASRGAQLGPDPVVRPVLDVLVGAHLQVEPADRRRAQAVEREAALVVRRRSAPRSRAATVAPGCPARRTDSRARRSAGPRRDRRAADAVEAVAAGDEVAGRASRPGRPCGTRSTAGRCRGRPAARPRRRKDRADRSRAGRR